MTKNTTNQLNYSLEIFEKKSINLFFSFFIFTKPKTTNTHTHNTPTSHFFAMHSLQKIRTFENTNAKIYSNTLISMLTIKNLKIDAQKNIVKLNWNTKQYEQSSSHNTISHVQYNQSNRHVMTMLTEHWTTIKLRK